MKFTKLNDQELLNALTSKAQTERNLTLEIIELLEEVDRRKLFLEQGYGSLLEFCVKVLKYSESAAYRRISAMRVVRDVPEVKQSITEGSLNLVSIAQAQTFINQERKYNHKIYSKEEKKDLILNLENKSKRECEKILLEKSPDLPKQEKVRQITEIKTQITLTIDQNLIEKLDQLKQKYSHINPNATYAELIEIMASKLLKTHKPQQSSKNQNLKQPEHKLLQREYQRHAATPPGEKNPQKRILEILPEGPSPEGSDLKNQQPRMGVSNRRPASRYIPATIKQEVYMRDKGQCTYVSPRTKQKCNSRHQLELDHIYPHAMGGENSPKNLRLVCRNHNQFYANRLFIPL